jgi:hypothetical protein
MRAYRAVDLTTLHDSICDKLVLGSADKLDVISTVDVQIHNVVTEAESLAWDFDLKNMWLTKSRWSMMVRQYLEPETLEAWIARCGEKIGTRGRGIALMRTKDVKPRGGAATGHTNKETRRWGSCMLNLSYKAKPAPQITLYSRTSYLGYIGALDLSVAWMAAKYLGHELGMEPEDFRFVWFNEAMQWHNFKSLAYLLNHRDEERRETYRRLLMARGGELSNDEKRLILGSPGLKLSRKWLQKVMKEDDDGLTYGDMTYNTYRRIRRRYHTEVHGFEYAQGFEGWSHYKKGPQEGEQKEFFKAYGELPSVHVKTLDFSPISMPFGQEYAGDYVGGGDEEDDDDE